MVSFGFASMPVERVPEASAVNNDVEEALVRLAARMKQSLATGDRRRHLFKKYADCFTGMEAVDWMLEQMEAKSVAEAVRKGQGLLTHRYIEKVDKETKFEYNKKRFFRFTPTTPEYVRADGRPTAAHRGSGPFDADDQVDRPMPAAALDLPLSAAARRRALAAILGGFVADAASTSLNGVSRPEKMIPNLLRLDFDPAFCGLYDTDMGASMKKGGGPGGKIRMESSTGFEARILLQCIARRGQVHGAQLAKDAFWGFKNDKRLLSATSRAFLKRVQNGKGWPHCAVKCRSIDVLSLIPLVTALYAGTNSLFTKVDELVKVFYVGTRVRDAALVAAFVLEQVILGASVLQAMRMGIRTERLSVKQRKVIFKAFTKSQLPSYEAIQKFGNRGSLPGGFCAVLQPLFVLNDYPTAVRENILGGGRTCRRAMFIGACFAAQDGLEAVPDGWLRKTQYFDFIQADAQALVARRELKNAGSNSTSFTDELEDETGVPYVDYPERVSLSASQVSMSASMSMSQGPNGPPPPLPPPRRPTATGNGRGHSTSFASSGGNSSPRSCASNFSYASQTTTGSSVRSVIDLGDMDRFYQSRGPLDSSQMSLGAASNMTPRSSSGRSTGSGLNVEMYKFFQAYGTPRNSGENGSFATSGTSTVRSSTDMARGSGNGELPYYQQQHHPRTSSGVARRNSEKLPPASAYGALRHSASMGAAANGARSSDGGVFYQSAYAATSRASGAQRHSGRLSARMLDTPERASYQRRASHQRPSMQQRASLSRGSEPFYQQAPPAVSAYLPEGDDVVLAHRVSLDEDQRVSLHAIL